MGEYCSMTIEIEKQIKVLNDRINQGDTSAYLELANLYYNQELHKKAEECYLKAVECEPNNYKTLFAAGAFYLFQGKNKKAEEYFLKAIELNQDDLDTLHNLGILYYNQGKNKKAEECFLRVLKINPCYKCGNYEYDVLGKLYFKTDQLRKAEECFTKAIEIDSKNPKLYYNLGVVYHNQANYSKAEECYLRAIRLSYKGTGAYSNLGLIYTDLNKFSEAEECFLKAIEIDSKNPKLYYNLGVVYHNQANYSKAEECYLRAIRINPKDDGAYFNLGVIYSDLGKSNEEEKYYLKAVKINPKNASSYNNLGTIYSKQGKEKKAEKYYLKAVELEPKEVIHLSNLGKTYFKLRDYKKAEEYLIAALKLNKNNDNVYYDLGTLFKVQNKYNQAEKYYLKAIQANPAMERAFFQLGLIYSLNKGFSKKKGYHYVLKAADLGSADGCLYAASFYYDYDIDVSFEQAVGLLKKAIELNNKDAYLELGNLYNYKYNEEKCLEFKKKALDCYESAKECGFDCDYEIKQLQNGEENTFKDQLVKFVLSNSINKETVTTFCHSLIGDSFNKLEDKSRSMIVRCIVEYITESQYGYDEADYSSAILNLAKALENEIDKYLGRNLVRYIKDNGLEKQYQDIVSRKKSRTLGEYQQEYKKEVRIFDDAHLESLRKCFKSDLFDVLNGDIHLTNYITNLVKEVKKFSETRNAAAHKGTISKEKC